MRFLIELESFPAMPPMRRVFSPNGQLALALKHFHVKYLVFECPRMVLFRELLLHRVSYSLGDGFFVEEMDLSLCWMDVNIDRPWINLKAEWTSARRSRGMNGK